MKIAPATIADVSTLVRLECECFAEPWSPATLATALEDERYVVLLACEDGGIPGYVLGWNVGEEGELARVGVLASRRGQGIAQELMAAMLAAFASRGVEAIFLEVRESNIAARRLYAKCNFVEVGERRNYYADAETALVMRVDL